MSLSTLGNTAPCTHVDVDLGFASGVGAFFVCNLFFVVLSCCPLLA